MLNIQATAALQWYHYELYSTLLCTSSCVKLLVMLYSCIVVQ